MSTELYCVRDAHGCYLVVAHDDAGTHFFWTQDSDDAAISDRDYLEYCCARLAVEQPDNAPFTTEVLPETH